MKKQTWTIAPVNFLSRRPKYSKFCAAVWLWVAYRPIFNSTHSSIAYSSRTHASAVTRSVAYHSSKPPTSISNSREADVYHYLDNSAISVLGFPTGFHQNQKNWVTPKFFQNQNTGFWLPVKCKPGFSVLNFDLQKSNYATILIQTACNVHD